MEKSTVRKGMTEEEKEFQASLAENIESEKALKNKGLVRIARRTDANSVIRRNGELTETAVLDFGIAAYSDLSGKVTVQMVVKFIRREFKVEVSRNRLVKHMKDNKHWAGCSEVGDHDVIRFN